MVIESDILTPSYSVEVATMPYFPCSGCKKTLTINTADLQHFNRPDDKSNPKKLIGSAICGCGVGTAFEITDNSVNYISGHSSYGSLGSGISVNVKTLYAEAEICLQSGAPNAAATMCRAALEIALTGAGFLGKNLKEQINNAHPPLDETEIILAHGSRLITNEAIHGAELIGLADIPSMLSATIQILNKLARPKV